MKLHVGTSGYGYKPWKGKFYPKDLPDKEMLSYYATQFGAVEINNTFYRLPKAAVLKAWLKEVPKTFIFSLKAPQQITHRQRLLSAQRPTTAFLKLAAIIGPQLGPLLFQLPPNFKQDLPRLREFLNLIPVETRVAFEFRHPSWFTDETYNLFRERNIALCIAESEETVEVPFAATADWGYLRLRRLDYTKAALKKWLTKIQSQAWSEAFIYFKHEDRALGPKFAKTFLDLL
jgi:uncharacterized protein YecE (DUF72 family)